MALVWIALVFTLLVLCLWMRLPVGVSLTLAALVAAMAFGIPPKRLLATAAEICIAEGTRNLALLVGLIFVLSLTLEERGSLKAISTLAAASARGNKLTATMPALIGLLPMPGGALFSAPMLKAVAGENIKPPTATVINYWFRHIWEYVWPLYPGFILAAEMTGLHVSKLALLLSPLTLLAVLLGCSLLYKKRSPKNGKAARNNNSSPHEGHPARKHTSCAISQNVPPAASETKSRHSKTLLLEACYPIALVVVLFLATPLSLPLSAAIAVLLTWFESLLRAKINASRMLKKVFTSRGLLNILLLAFGAKLFGGMVSASGASTQIRQALDNLGLPFAAVVIILPFLVGLLSGIAAAFVAATFPVLFGTILTHIPNFAAMVTLAYLFGFMGVMLSPSHACLILSAQYFAAQLRYVYRLLFTLIIPMCILGTGIAAVYALANVAI